MQNQIQLVIRLGEVVAVIIPKELSARQMMLARALVPEGLNNMELVRAWDVYGVIALETWYPPRHQRPGDTHTLAFTEEEAVEAQAEVMVEAREEMEREEAGEPDEEEGEGKGQETVMAWAM